MSSDGVARRYRGRYWLFCGDWYYPDGGMQDFCLSTDNLDEAKAMADQLTADHCDWHEILDTHSDKTL